MLSLLRSLHLIGTATLAVATLLTFTPTAYAQLDTVNWSPDAATDGSGTGTLSSGTITVTYLTIPGVGNAGITIADNWAVSLATDAVAGGGVTNLSGGVFGTTNNSPFSQIILFSAPVTNPILLANFTDGTAILQSLQPFVLLDSNNAQDGGGGALTAVGSTNSFNDGFAVVFPGTFGPGTPLQFLYSTSAGFDSVGFTIGISSAGAPEPGTVALMGVGLCMAGIAIRRRKR